MIVYVPGRMPSAARLGAYYGHQQPGHYGQQLLLVHRDTLANGSQGAGYNYPSSLFQQQHQPPSPPASPPQDEQILGPRAWPRAINGPSVMPQDEEMQLVPGHAMGPAAGQVVVHGPPSPAHSDSDASSSSLELGSVRRNDHSHLKCR